MKTITQAEYDALPIVDGWRRCPGNTDYSQITSFGGDANFVGGASFGGYARFRGDASFGGGSGFGGHAIFGGNANFVGGANFGGNAIFVGNANFGGYARFGGYAIFGGDAIFGGYARFIGDASFVGEARFGGDANFGGCPEFCRAPTIAGRLLPSAQWRWHWSERLGIPGIADSACYDEIGDAVRPHLDAILARTDWTTWERMVIESWAKYLRRQVTP